MQQEYFVVSTVFLFAQCFAWIEIIRKEIQYLQASGIQESKKNKKIRVNLENLQSLLSTDKVLEAKRRDIYGRQISVFVDLSDKMAEAHADFELLEDMKNTLVEVNLNLEEASQLIPFTLPETAFQIHKEEQGALGELMLKDESDNSKTVLAHGCLGYWSFLKLYRDYRCLDLQQKLEHPLWKLDAQLRFLLAVAIGEAREIRRSRADMIVGDGGGGGKGGGGVVAVVALWC